MSRMTISCALFLALGVAAPGFGQDIANRGEDDFAPENAIIDVSIPFAIGAREARQELRGAFGWPTFQEGLVEGVYFRFDPDGYARFAPTPRLDTDVFEVICRPGTLNCMGRKGALAVYVNAQGALQLQSDEAGEGDTFFIVDGLTEIQVPPYILGPLDPRLEALLASGGELVIRRGAAEVVRTSLIGFNPVAAYLRWITSRQDYTVLPRGWPVPSSTSADENTAAVNWIITRPAEQNQPVFDREEAAVPGTDVTDVREEISALRQLLVDRENSEAPVVGPMTETGATVAAGDPAQIVRTPLEQLAALAAPGETNVSAGMEAEAPTEPSPTRRMAEQLEYLMTEIGLDAETALLLVQSRIGREGEAAEPQVPNDAIANVPLNGADGHAGQADVVREILEELRADLVTSEPPAKPADDVPAEEFQLLTDYFRSVSETWDD